MTKPFLGVLPGRSYPESCVAGDYAYYLSMEYRWKAYSSDRLTLTLAPFLEFGQSFVVEPSRTKPIIHYVLLDLVW